MIKKQTVEKKQTEEKPVEAKAKVRARSEFPTDLVLRCDKDATHGCRPGSQRAIIMDRILNMVAEKATVGQILSAIRPLRGGPEDLRILVSKGVVTAEGIEVKPTRAMTVKLKAATEEAPAKGRKSA